MPELTLKYIFNTNKERQTGLMFKKPLLPFEGALFIWEGTSIGYMWNKNVSFPIDVAFFDEEEKLINIEHLKSHQKSPVFSTGRFKYVLETSYGWFRKNKVTIHTKLTSIVSKKSLDNKL